MIVTISEGILEWIWQLISSHLFCIAIDRQDSCCV